MFVPSLHVCSGEYAPLIEHISFLAVGTFVVTGIDIQSVTIDKGCRVAQILILNERV
jgi:hypothetical protein